jgi:hypothetical protein
MDRELRGTTLAQSFERLKSDKGLHAETRGRSGKTDEAQVASDDNDGDLSDGSDDSSDAWIAWSCQLIAVSAWGVHAYSSSSVRSG